MPLETRRRSRISQNLGGEERSLEDIDCSQSPQTEESELIHRLLTDLRVVSSLLSKYFSEVRKSVLSLF